MQACTWHTAQMSKHHCCIYVQLPISDFRELRLECSPALPVTRLITFLTTSRLYDQVSQSTLYLSIICQFVSTVNVRTKPFLTETCAEQIELVMAEARRGMWEAERAKEGKE